MYIFQAMQGFEEQIDMTAEIPHVTCSLHSQTFCRIHLCSRYLGHSKQGHHSQEPEDLAEIIRFHHVFCTVDTKR